MDNKNKFNTVKIATCNDAHKAEAVNQLFERSLLFNRSDDICGIVISKNDEKQFIPISAIPDNVNIEKRDGVVTLVENPIVDSITTKADHNGVDWKSQHKIAETSAERTIILLCTKNIEGATNIGVIGGEILEVGEGIYGNYKISLTPAGSGLLIGATTSEQKAAIVRAKYNGTYYYGIKFKSTVPANIYFYGWDHFPDGADAPLYTSYTDADLSEIIELGGGDSGGSSGGGMTEEEKAEINGKIDALQGQVASAIVSIDGIEQKLSDIFSAENKVTDFNTTTNSGIYYWLDDAANKPSANYGVLLVNKYDGGSNIWVNQVAYGTNKKIYFRQNINSGNWTEWKAVAFDGEGTADSANKITPNYTRKTLAEVTSDTTKYIKLADCTWDQTGTLQVYLTGANIVDTLVIDFGGGNGLAPNLCGHYSGHDNRVLSVIAQKGLSWDSNYSIYIKINQLTTCNVNIALLKGDCTINISESTTAPTNIFEWTVGYGLFGNITAPNITSLEESVAGKADAEHTHTKSQITDFAHTHDDRYFTETEVTDKLAGKSDTGHKHSASDITSGTLPVANGGTGATDAASGFNTLADGVRDSTTPRDDEKMLLKPTGTWYKTTCLDFWNYIKDKISSKLVIPIGAPSQLEDGCIWIQ